MLTMRQVLPLMLFFAVLIGLGGCKESPPPPSAFTLPMTQVVQPTTGFNLGVAQTVGNHTYIPINRGGDPADYVLQILGLVDAFEKQHPELEVTGFQVEKQQYAYTTPTKIFGLWIHHRLRVSCPK